MPFVSFSEDELGRCAFIDFEVEIYPLTAIKRAAYWFTDRCYLFLSWRDEKKELVRVCFRGKTQLSDAELKLLCCEFCNSVLDFCLREVVSAETKVERESIVRRAFSEVLPK